VESELLQLKLHDDGCPGVPEADCNCGFQFTPESLNVHLEIDRPAGGEAADDAEAGAAAETVTEDSDE